MPVRDCVYICVCESTYVCMCVHVHTCVQVCVCVDCAIQRETSRPQVETVLSWQDSGPAWTTQQSRSRDTAYGKYFALISTPRNPARSRLAPLCTQDRVCVLTTVASPGEVSGKQMLAPPWPLSHWVTWSKSLHFSEPWMSHL